MYYYYRFDIRKPLLSECNVFALDVDVVRDIIDGFRDADEEELGNSYVKTSDTANEPLVINKTKNLLFDHDICVIAVDYEDEMGDAPYIYVFNLRGICVENDTLVSKNWQLLAINGISYDIEKQFITSKKLNFKKMVFDYDRLVKGDNVFKYFNGVVYKAKYSLPKCL